MSNKLNIQTVEVRHLQENDRREFGVLLFDEIACFNVLDFGSEAEVPQTLAGVVAHCKERGLADVLDLLQHHEALGADANYCGKPASNGELRRALSGSAHAIPAAA